VVFLGVVWPAATGLATYLAGPAAGVAAAAAFALPLLYALPDGRAFWARHRDWLLVTQALLTYVPLALFGSDWIPGLAGLLGGLLLLTVAAPVSWLLFAAAVAAEGLVRVAVVGLPHVLIASEAVLVFVIPVYLAVALFGLIRLGGLVTGLHAARTELASLAVARERLRAAERLRVTVDSRLDAVTSSTRAALAVLDREPEQARDRLAEAADAARQALDQVRQMIADDRRAPWPDPSASQDPDTEPTLAPKLARLVLVVVLATMSAQLVVDALAVEAAWVAAASVAGILALAALQLYHSTRWREGARPPGWRWTLSAQLLLTAAGFFPVLHPAIHGLGGFVAGSALLLLPGRWGWVAFAGIQAAIAAHVAVLTGRDATDLIFTIMGTVTTGLVVYGLSRLTGLAVELDEMRRELARSAVVGERMRVARDTHDLLGMGLSAIALKCDLAGRLIGRDDAKAHDEISALVRLTVRSRAEVRSLTSERSFLSLRAELDAARQVLASADVAVDIRGESAAAVLPEEVGTVLATVLREAVTNVLRHAEATRCEIELTSDDGDVRLRVANDGVRVKPDDAQTHEQRWRVGGHGLANLTARAVAFGGRLSTHVEGSRFELTFAIPRTSSPLPSLPL